LPGTREDPAREVMMIPVFMPWVRPLQRKIRGGL
jgi:hypothetical protein